MKKLNPEDKKKRVTICLDPEIDKKLNILTKVYNRSRSNMIEELINVEYRNITISGTYDPLIERKLKK